MRIESISIRGTSDWNEDALIVNERLGLYGVADGATSLHPYRGPNGETGGYIASSLVREYMESLRSEESEGLRLDQLVAQANLRLFQAMKDADVDMDDPSALWTCALALLRVGDGSVEYAQVGDCMAAALYDDGSVRVLTRDQVDHIDQESRQVWIEGVRSGIARRDALWEMVKPIIMKNKERMNKENGFCVLNGRPETAHWIEYGKINRSGLAALLIVSDGLFLPYSLDGTSRPGMDELMVRIREEGLHGYAEWLMALEAEDAECQVYPRFKVSDDKTGIWIEFKE